MHHVQQATLALSLQPVETSSGLHEQLTNLAHLSAVMASRQCQESQPRPHSATSKSGAQGLAFLHDLSLRSKTLARLTTSRQSHSLTAICVGASGSS